MNNEQLRMLTERVAKGQASDEEVKQFTDVMNKILNVISDEIDSITN